MASTLKCTVMYTEKLTEGELLDAIEPWEDGYMKLARLIYNLPKNQQRLMPKLEYLVKLSIKLDAATYREPDLIYFEVLKEVSDRIQNMLEHGQGLPLYDVMRMELLHEMTANTLMGEHFDTLRSGIDKWIAAIGGK